MDNTPIILRKAEIKDTAKILTFYRNVIDSIEESKFRPKWNASYPNLEYIETSTEKEELYVCTEGSTIIACIVLNNRLEPEFENIKWRTDAKPDEITAIHTFAVNSRFAGKGIGKEIIGQIKKNAIKNNQKSIRIDIIDGNVGAQKFFKKQGFEYIGAAEIFHKAVGLEKFHCYEYALKEMKNEH